MRPPKNCSPEILRSLVQSHLHDKLLPNEREWLEKTFGKNKNRFPTLEQIWQLMDEQWISHQCDPSQANNNLIEFYNHPVWLLNGLFIEQDADSLAHRRAFTDWIVQQTPARIADFGGGFGGLARFVGQALPDAQVEVVEPHPRAIAIAMAANTPNVRFVPELTGEYDLMIATDVFEHVLDPLGLCADTATHLKVGGQYLIANCFAPVIKCHLPQLFHFEYGWNTAMQALGLMPGDRVRYGHAYRRIGPLNLAAARKAGELAHRLYPIIRHIPRGRTLLGHVALKLLGKVL